MESDVLPEDAFPGLQMICFLFGPHMVEESMHFLVGLIMLVIIFMRAQHHNLTPTVLISRYHIWY